MTHHPTLHDLSFHIRDLAPPCAYRNEKNARCPEMCTERKTSATVCKEFKKKHSKMRMKGTDITSGPGCSDAQNKRRLEYIGEPADKVNPETILECYVQAEAKTSVRNVLSQSVNRDYKQPQIKRETWGMDDSGREPNVNLLRQKMKEWKQEEEEEDNDKCESKCFPLSSNYQAGRPSYRVPPFHMSSKEREKYCEYDLEGQDTRMTNMSGNRGRPTTCDLLNQPINAIGQVVRPCYSMPPVLYNPEEGCDYGQPLIKRETFGMPGAGRDPHFNLLRQKVKEWQPEDEESVLLDLHSHPINAISQPLKLNEEVCEKNNLLGERKVLNISGHLVRPTTRKVVRPCPKRDVCGPGPQRHPLRIEKECKKRTCLQSHALDAISPTVRPHPRFSRDDCEKYCHEDLGQEMRLLDISLIRHKGETCKDRNAPLPVKAPFCYST